MVSGSFTVGIDIDPCRLREAILNAFTGNYIGFLSTNSELINVAPTAGQISSKRAGSVKLAGALTCVPFDVFVERDRRWTVEQISTLDFLGLFGRPL